MTMSPHDASASRLWRAIRELNKMVSAFGRDRLPQIFEELLRYRVPPDIVDALRGLVAEGYTEDEIVQAFLDALRPLAIRFNASRALVRSLNDFTWSWRHRALEQRIAAIIAAPAGGDTTGHANVA
jgi:hypothetical protein